MPTFLGTAGASSGLPGHEPKVVTTLLSRTSSQFVVRYQVGSNAINHKNTSGTFSGTLKVNGSSYSVSGTVAKTGGIFWTKDITYNQASAATLAISLTGSIPGTTGWTSTSLSGTMSVAAGIEKPTVPTNFSFSRTSDTTVVINFSKGTRAASTQIATSHNGGSWSNLGNPTGSSYTATNRTVNSYWRFRAYSKNAGGNSSTVGPFVIYTKPSKPSKPVLASNKLVTWKNSAAYVHGVEVQRTNNGGSTIAQVASLGAVTSWTDPKSQQPLTQYRVRFWAGPSADEDKTFSDWSDWSDNVMALVYDPPQINTFTAERSLGGVSNPLGTDILVRMTGEFTPPALVAGNKWRLDYRYKKATDPWPVPELWINFQQNQVSNTFSKTWTFGSGSINEQETYDVELRLMDVYDETYGSRTVPVGSVALSLSKVGAGVGMIWEEAGRHADTVLQVGGNIEVADPNVVVIDGLPYEMSGVVDIPSATYTSTSQIFYRYIDTYLTSALDTPPTGWGYTFYVTQSSGSGTWVTTTSSNRPILYAAASTARSCKVAWRLQKGGWRP